METEKKKQIIEFVKKWKVLFIILMIALIIITIIASKEIINRNSIVKEVENKAIELSLNDVSGEIIAKNDYGYAVTIKCSNIDSFNYEQIYQIAYKIESGDVDRVTIESNGNTYTKIYNTLYKNGDKVYEKKSSSSSSSHKCVECGSSASRSYKSPFSGQTEWYCSSCYRELQDLLDQFGMN